MKIDDKILDFFHKVPSPYNSKNPYIDKTSFSFYYFTLNDDGIVKAEYISRSLNQKYTFSFGLHEKRLAFKVEPTIAGLGQTESADYLFENKTFDEYVKAVSNTLSGFKTQVKTTEKHIDNLNSHVRSLTQTFSPR